MITAHNVCSRTGLVAALCTAVFVGSLISAPTAIASPLSDLLDALGSGSSGPETTSPAPRPATVQFLSEFPAGSTATFSKTSSSCVDLPADPTAVRAVGSSVTLTVGQSRARECQGRSGDATYTVVVTTATQRWYGGFRLKVNFGDVPATFIACTDVVPAGGGRPMSCVRYDGYATLLYLPG